MKVLLITLTFVFSLSIANAQNLVRNPSFEEGAESLCDFMIWADLFYHYVYDWECPTNGTSDIFNSTIPNQTCWAAMPGKSGGPYKRIGSQMPRTNSRFAGIYVHSPDGYREYLHTELITPLLPGKSYCAAMYVSLADRVQMATNNLGMHLGTKRIRIYSVPNSIEFFITNLDITPQILETNVIKDSTSWVKIYGNFVADSAYTHLTIGNFFSTVETTAIEQPGWESVYANMSYYFIEDVSVAELEHMTFSVTGNTVICKGDSSTVTAVSTLEEVEWTTLADPLTVIAKGAKLTVKPSVTTAYRVSGKNCKRLVMDTVEITVVPFTDPYIGKDTVICKGETITISPVEDYFEYRWQDQSVGSSITVTNAGTYSVTVKNEVGCSGYDEMVVSVKEPPAVELGDDIIVCEKYPRLVAGTSQYDYVWSTGATTPFILPAAIGKYWVLAENSCGLASDTVNIYSYDAVKIPNIITPNGDSWNEQFIITGLPLQAKPALTVMNRWGKEVFSRVNYNNDWPDGNQQENLPGGIYYYSVLIPGCRSYKGWLHIVR